MQYKLIALDLDGTLNNDQKQITPLTRSALMQAQQKGVRIALASARPSPGLRRESEILHLSEHRGILMSYNGGRIVSAESGETLFETAMELQSARSVLRQLESLPVTPILDDGRQFFVTDKNGYMVDYECKNNCMDCTEVENLADFLSFAPAKILMSADPAHISSIQAQIAALLPDPLRVVQTADFYLEIVPRTVNKGKGLWDVCRILGLSAEEAVAFGDAENDIPMLESAGMGVAMGNAASSVKAAADRIARSNNEDGIAHMLIEMGVVDPSLL